MSIKHPNIMYMCLETLLCMSTIIIKYNVYVPRNFALYVNNYTQIYCMYLEALLYDNYTYV